jgi:5'-3' exonuclease
MIFSLIKKNPTAKIRVFWDGKKHPERQRLLGGNYKGHRAKKLDSTRDELLLQLPQVVELLRVMGITQVHNIKHEADDLIYKYLKKERKKNPNLEVMIVSTDKDFHQLVDENTYVYHGIKDLEIRPANMANHYGYTPEECVAYLCLTGDSTDDIPGVGGIGPATARKLLNKTSPSKLFKNPEKYLTPAQSEILQRNRILIDLPLFNKKHGFKLSWKEVVMKGEFMKQKYLRMCAEFGLKRFSTETFYKILE